jgi:rhodanese-related sulfurtransferase
MCDASTDAAAILLKKGFKKISEYKGGIQDWVAGGNPTE